jgi:hypothetical protein
MTVDENKFDYNYKSEYEIYKSIQTNNTFSSNYWLVEYWALDNKFYVAIDNVEWLYWFTGSILNWWLSSFVFDSLDSPLSDEPLLQVKSNMSYVNYFRLDSTDSWTGSLQQVVWVKFNDDLVDISWIIDSNINDSNFIFNKTYYFNRTDLKGFLFSFW